MLRVCDKVDSIIYIFSVITFGSRFIVNNLKWKNEMFMVAF